MEFQTIFLNIFIFFKLCLICVHCDDSSTPDFNTQELVPEQVKQNLTSVINSINNTLNEYRLLMDVLNSRISKKDKDIEIKSYQNYRSIVISEESNYLVLQEKSRDIGEMLNLSPENGDWNFNQILSYENQTKLLLQDTQIYRNLIDKQTVWANRSEFISGSCCMMANISIETGLPMVVDDLIIKRDSDDAYLDGDITWGFISLDDVDRDISGVVTFDQSIRANTLETPSVDLNSAFLLDHEPMVIRGNLSIDKLEMDTATFNFSRSTAYNLMSVVQINGSSPSTLDNLSFDLIKVNNIKDTVVSNINLTHLLDTQTNQTITSAVSVKKVELDGSSLSGEDEFVEKIIEKLNAFVNNSDFMKYNKVVIDSINVTDFYTEAWDDWISLNTNETIKIDKVKINGNVNLLDVVNNMRWDNLVYADNTGDMEEIESSIVFVDEIAMTEDLAYDLLKTNITPSNWVIHGDLNITQQLNNHLFDEFLESLIPLDGSVDELEFTKPVSMFNCYFKQINDIETVNLGTYGNISYPLTFDDFDSYELTLHGWDINSCLTRNGLYKDSTMDQPIDNLHIISLKLNGTINDIDPAHLLINGSNQDFRSLNSALTISSDIDFESIEIGSANIDVSHLNGLELKRLLREDPELKWPETLILSHCNITSLHNSWLEKFFNSTLLTETDQTFNVAFQFEGDVDFEDAVTFTDSSTSIRLNYDQEFDPNWSNLHVKGYITAHHVYETSKRIEIYEGLKANQLIVNKLTESNDKIIYKDSTWNVHRKPFNQSVKFISMADELIILGDLKVVDEQAIAWLSSNSYKGIEFYSEVKLEDNLTVKIPGNCSYKLLKNEKGEEIKLNEMIVKSADPLDLTFFEDVTFAGDVTINGNMTADNHINISMFPYDNYNFDLSNSTSATFTDEVAIVEDLN